MKKIAIVGGGISGLAAAYYLQEASQGNLEIALFEERPRLGGVIETEMRNGFILESGPDCFLSKKNAARDLCRQLGLGHDLIPTLEAFRRSFIYQKGKLTAVPEGFYLVAPRKLWTLVKMPQLSFWGKLRAVMELFMPKRFSSPDLSAGDESIASFIRRRFGREVYERIGQPMIGGIYGGDPETLSLEAALPQFREMEEKYGSVIRGLRHQEGAHESASGPRYSLFLSLRQGMEQMVRGLVKELTQVKIYTACAVASLRARNDGAPYRLDTEDGRIFEADAVLLALPAFRAAALVRNFAPELAAELDSIPYESMATLHLAYRRSDVPASFNGVGFVVPKIEKSRIPACTFSSLKFEGRSPEGDVLLRVFVGGAFYKEEFQLDDKAMEQMVREELEKILGLTARPLLISIRRFRNSMPQYQVGHPAKIASIESRLAAYPGLFLTGNAYEGIGIPDCIAHAEKQVKKILAGV